MVPDVLGFSFLWCFLIYLWFVCLYIAYCWQFFLVLPAIIWIFCRSSVSIFLFQCFICDFFGLSLVFFHVFVFIILFCLFVCFLHYYFEFALIYWLDVSLCSPLVCFILGCDQRLFFQVVDLSGHMTLLLMYCEHLYIDVFFYSLYYPSQWSLGCVCETLLSNGWACVGFSIYFKYLALKLFFLSETRCIWWNLY